MPGSRKNRSRSSSRSRSRSRSPIRAPPPSPVPYQGAPPAPTLQNRTTSIANIIAEGFAWGTGVSVAKNIFNSGEQKDDKKTIYSEKNEITVNKDDLWKKYNECIEKTDGSKCNDIIIEDIN